ncbi:MAG: putative oxidoreductase [Arcticibacterium sp.]|jgi:putative oxidoreductase
MFKKFFKVSTLTPSVDLSIFILRVGIGILMVTHGYPKLLKILNNQFSFADPIGFGETTSLVLAVFAEFFCSLLLVLGFLTRPALFFLIFTMTIVVCVVKIDQGLVEMEKGLLFLLPFISLFIWGPGRYSLDFYIFGKKSGPVRN